MIAHRAIAAASLLLLLPACELHFQAKEAEELVSLCEPVVFEDAPLTHCAADSANQVIGMDLAPERQDAPYRSLRELSYTEPDPTQGQIVFAMNGGMFDEEGQPIGYYVEDGRRLTVLNQNEGPGNFHLLPNGVFFGQAGGPWKVLDTQAFADQIENRPDFATQSGPMLVVNGELHPSIDPNGTSYKIRNAVGVDASGRAHFVISDAPISFGRLARYFRDVLNVRNALFLDGSVSGIWDPATGRLDTGADIGPIIVVRQREDNP